ncbi:MAG: glycine cleavage system protein T [Anaerolineae bacterium]|jgi:folate-binding protein YgfZ|nr:glycine cleavage system protein T [Anaerolineae bacterium]
MHLRDYHTRHGAQVAPDGIPLQYHAPEVEYRAALSQAILLDRSHEGRIALTGADRAALIQRMSTHEIEQLAIGVGTPTLFLTPNGRIIDRVLVYRDTPDSLLMITGPGRGGAVADYLRRNIFFRDQVTLTDQSASTAQFSLHGPTSDAILESIAPGISALAPLHGQSIAITGGSVWVARRKSYSGPHWLIVTPSNQAETVWGAIMTAGASHGLLAAGSLTFNTLRICAGRPGVGRELTADHIPLELGLWDEVSFQKGCYTGQEIIARMESRNKLAKTLVTLQPESPITPPADIFAQGKRIGTLTSSVTAPDGVNYALGLVKVSHAVIGQSVMIGTIPTTITGLPGVQPPNLAQED